MSDAEQAGTATVDAPEPPVAGPAAADSAEPPRRPSFADALTDFVQMFVDYVRQETGDLVKDKVVVPTQKAGQVVAFALAAAGVLVMGIGYLSVGLMLVLAGLLGWPGALFLVGGVLVAGAGVFTYLKVKRMQR